MPVSIRRTPYEHYVREHFRSGIKVRKYKRGEGDAPELNKVEQRRLTPRKNNNEEEDMNGLNVKIQYVSGGSESIDVDTTNFSRAISDGLIKRKSYNIPKRITISGDDI